MNGELVGAALVIGGLGLFAWPLLIFIALISVGVMAHNSLNKKRK